MYADGNLAINQQSIKWRTKNITATGIDLKIFFGGGEPEYATPMLQYTYFKDVAVYGSS